METKLKKNQTANVGKYSYQYVDIAQIHDYLESINSKYIQSIKRIDTDDYVMTKRCFDGVWEEEWLQGAKVVDATLQGVKNPAQEQGSALTYARRYSLLMAYGLATEDDDAQCLSKPIEVTQEEADNYKLTFGKYKDKTLKEVYESDEKYIQWIIGNTQDNRMLELIKLATGIEIPSEEESKERLELMNKVNNLILDTDTDHKELYKHFKVKSLNELTIAQLKECEIILEKKLEKQND